MVLDPLSPVPRYQQVARILREQIETGKLTEGDAIPSRQQLQDTYGIARDTAAKALRVLVGEGLVVVVPGMGARVARSKRLPRMPESAEQDHDDKADGRKGEDPYRGASPEAPELSPVHH